MSTELQRLNEQLDEAYLAMDDACREGDYPRQRTHEENVSALRYLRMVALRRARQAHSTAADKHDGILR